MRTVRLNRRRFQELCEQWIQNALNRNEVETGTAALLKLASALDTTPKSIDNWSSGKQSPYRENWRLAAKVFQVEPESLLELPDRMNVADMGPDGSRNVCIRKTTVEGHPIQYLDNRSTNDADVVVFYLHGLGLDCRDFYAMMNHSRYRSIAPTMIGFHPGDAYVPNLDLQQHCDILGGFMETCVRDIPKIRKTIVVGFSIGADVAFQVLGKKCWAAPGSIGLLALDCNLSSDTCFISKRLATMNVDAPTKTLVRIASRLASDKAKLGAWLEIHEYLVKVFRKLAGNLAPLKELAQEIKARFDTRTLRRFFDYYSAVTKNGVAVRCVLSDSPQHRALCKTPSMRTKHELVIGIADNTSHFDLIEEPKRLEEYVGEMVHFLDSMEGKRLKN